MYMTMVDIEVNVLQKTLLPDDATITPFYSTSCVTNDELLDAMCISRNYPFL